MALEDPILLVPLLDIPVGCIHKVNDDHSLLRTLRETTDRKQGYFMLRYFNLRNPGGTFVLTGDLKFTGRWSLGRIRKHPTQPGRYEILVRRAKTCYYQSVDSMARLIEELRILAVDGDGDLANAASSQDSPWYVKSDPEFEDTGFSSESVVLI